MQIIQIIMYSEFCETVMKDLPNKDFMKSVGFRNMDAEDLIAVLKRMMSL